MSETALFSFGKVGVRNETVNRLLRDPRRLLVDLLTANTITNVLFSSFGAYCAIRISRDIGVEEGVGLGVGVWVMTIALIVGGEIVPKTFAVKRAESIVRKVAGIVWLCSFIILPIRRILLKVADIFVLFIEKRLRLKRVRPLFTQEVLSTALKMGEEEKAIEESDLKMMRGILRFGKGVVRDVMTPKERIVSSSKNGTIEEIIRLIQKTGYSRIPIYEGRVDNIIGVVHARDLLPYMDEGKEPELSRLIRDVYIVSPAKRVDDLLHEMQTRRYQMAIVRTHHGRLLGLVTMEDLLEEIFGEIEDEYDLLVMGGKG